MILYFEFIHLRSYENSINIIKVFYLFYKLLGIP